MQLHQLKRPMQQKRTKRVGRGGKRGTYSGRGMKGQKSRAGAKIRPAIRDFIKKIPKLRGAEGRGMSPPQKAKPVAVALSAVIRSFDEGEKITPKALVAKGLVQKRFSRVPTVKLLGSGKITKKLLVAHCQISKGARAAIEAAGGIVSS